MGRRAHAKPADYSLSGRLNAAFFFAQTRQFSRHAKPLLTFVESMVNIWFVVKPNIKPERKP